jgi:tRNA threonylcarbamoyladenosine biosynthesis protein TsaE
MSKTQQQFSIKSLPQLKNLANFILPSLKPNFFLLLQGDLGVGKTTFTQMIAKQLGIKEKITSPTFTICQQYQIKNNYYLNHFDFFRLSTKDDLDYFQELTFNNLNIIE